MEKESLVKKLGIFKSGDKKIKWITIIGLAGIALICLSQFWPSSSSNADADIADMGTTVYTAEEYEAMLEERITALVSNMEGAGQCQVMVTLESGPEYIYEKETNSNSTNNDSNSSKSENYSESYVILGGSGGEKTALVRMTVEPKIKGVVIVCEGAGRATTVEQITNAVTTAFDLNNSQVYVSKLASE